MKKTLMFLAAILTMTMAAVSFTSCSDDDDDKDKVQSFTVLVKIESSSVTAEELAEINKYVQTKYPPYTIRTTKSEAINKFNLAVITNEVECQAAIDKASAETGFYDLAYVFLLLDEKDNIVRQAKFYPRKR